MTDNPQRRYNPLNGEYVVISPQRAKRPWQSSSPRPAPRVDSYDPACFLCPRNSRSSLDGKHAQNPDYQDIYVFDNDFPALMPNAARSANGAAGAKLSAAVSQANSGEAEAAAPGNSAEAKSQTAASPLFRQEAISGICRVICYSHRHDLHLGAMTESAILKVIDEWINQLAVLGEQYQYVQVFENKGEQVGCSSPHPHGQIWALDYEPQVARVERKYQQEYYQAHKRQLLLDYLDAELKQQQRIVCENQHWVLLVPYWAYWPYETLLLPRRPIATLLQLNDEEKQALAELLKTLICKYDNLFQFSFPYMMGWHGGCRTPAAASSEQLHCHFYPPLLDPIKRKYRAGFEEFAELQRDLTPEEAARRLREV